MRNFWRNLSCWGKKRWILISLSTAENFKAMMRFVKEKEGRPPGPALFMAATVRIPASSRRIFYFLQDEKSRSKVCML